VLGVLWLGKDVIECVLVVTWVLEEVRWGKQPLQMTDSCKARNMCLQSQLRHSYIVFIVNWIGAL
jgi:hypothetical protein